MNANEYIFTGPNIFGYFFAYCEISNIYN